jgi:penicillin-binding protein 1C
VHLDPGGEWQVHGDCQSVAAMRSEPWFVLPPAMEFYYRRLHAGYRVVPPYRADCREAAGVSGDGSLALIYPKQGAQVFVPIEMDGRMGRVVFEAAHRAPEMRVYWHLDDSYLGETRDIHEMALAPPPGPHRLTLVDENGETVSRVFTVLGRDAPRSPTATQTQTADTDRDAAGT